MKRAPKRYFRRVAVALFVFAVPLLIGVVYASRRDAAIDVLRQHGVERSVVVVDRFVKERENSSDYFLLVDDVERGRFELAVGRSLWQSVDEGGRIAVTFNPDMAVFDPRDASHVAVGTRAEVKPYRGEAYGLGFGCGFSLAVASLFLWNIRE